MTLFTEKDARPFSPRNPLALRIIPNGFSDPKIAGGDDTIYISEGANERWQVGGGEGINTLEVDYSKVKTSHGLRYGASTGSWSGELFLSESSWDKKIPYINYAQISKLKLTGTSLDDHFPNTSSDDVIIGGAGNDTLRGRLGKDILDGGEGTDLLIANFSLKADNTRETAAQSINNTSTSRLPNGTTITGIEQFEITTGNGDDVITLSGDYDDKITTGGGSDTIDPGRGKDIVDGGTGGADLLIVDYSKANYGIHSSYSSYNGKIYTSPTGKFDNAENSVDFKLIERLNITGTKFADELQNTSYNDILIGNAGDDTLWYAGGVDKLDGGPDKDTLKLNLARFKTIITLNTDKPGATVSGTIKDGVNSTPTTYVNMERLDAVTGGGDDNIDWLGDGDDVIKTNGGDDVLISGGGNDTLDGGVGDDMLIGVNPDAFQPQPGKGEIDWLTGSDGKDSFYVGDSRTTYYEGGDYRPPLPGSDITVEQLKAIMPQITDANAQKYVGVFNSAMKEFAIDTPKRQEAFIAQVAHETLQLNDDLRENWGPTSDQKMYEPIFDANNKLVTQVLNPKTGKLEPTKAQSLGNINKGDGFLFRGRGFLQITGRYNYHEASKKLDYNLEKYPDNAATDPLLAARVGGYFWETKNLNTYADSGDFLRISKIINGGSNGKDERQDFYERAQKVLGNDGWAYDNDHAIIDKFIISEDTVILHGKAEDYYLVKDHPIVGSKSTVSGGGIGSIPSTIVVHEHDGIGGLSKGDDVLAIIRGANNLTLYGNNFQFV